MSLFFTQASTNKVTVTNPLTVGAGTEFTYITWVRQSAVPGNSQGTGKGGIDLFTYFNNWFIEVPRATAASIYQVSDASLFPTLNEWVMYAATYSEVGGADIYRATLTSGPALLTAAARDAGSGATTANTGDLWINNRSATSALSPAHNNSYVQLFNKKLTLAEIIRVWRNPRNLHNDPNTRMLLRLGNNGTGTQFDLSGNLNHGIVTGARWSENPPFRKYPRIAKYSYLSADGSPVTANLTGNALTIASGSLSASVAPSLSGNSLSATQGSLTPGVSYSLSGNAVIASIGTVSPAVSASLSGQGITVSQGSLSPAGDVAKSLTGIELSVGIGTLTPVVTSTDSASNWYEWPTKRLYGPDEDETEEIIDSLAKKQVKKLDTTESVRAEELRLLLNKRGLILKQEYLLALEEQRGLLLQQELAIFMQELQIERDNADFISVLLLAGSA